jgi:signal peptidase II
VALGVAAVVVVVDQVTKALALEHLGPGRTHVLGPFGFALGYNTGSAFSLFTGHAVWLGLLVVVLVAVLAAVAWRAGSTLLAVALGLMIGGALGNLSDRLFRGHHGAVVDFVTLTHWPTFNVADAAITAGAVLVVIALLVRPATLAAPGVASGETGPHND